MGWRRADRGGDRAGPLPPLVLRSGRCLNVAVDHGPSGEPAFLRGIENLPGAIEGSGGRRARRHPADARPGICVGSESQGAWPAVAGGTFEFGFPDAIEEMLAVYFAKRAGAVGARFECATPTKSLRSHQFVDVPTRSWDQGCPVSGAGPR
jgi:hypothetical protein